MAEHEGHAHGQHEHTHDTHDAHGQHEHAHTHTETKAVLNRMSRIIGHMNAIKGMIESGRDCSEVLIQLSAVSSALNGVSKVILKDHLEHCLTEAVREGDHEAIENLKKAIDKFM